MKVQTKQQTILWADDDEEDLELFREVLLHINHSFTIVEVTNGREVLDYLNSRTSNDYPCLIILDMNMPILSGRDTLKALKSQTKYKDIPVIVFTTSSSELDKSFCKHFNTEMITKPPAYDQLKKIIARFLKTCNREDKNHS